MIWKFEMAESLSNDRKGDLFNWFEVVEFVSMSARSPHKTSLNLLEVIEVIQSSLS